MTVKDRIIKSVRPLILLIPVLLLSGCGRPAGPGEPQRAFRLPFTEPDPLALIPNPRTPAEKIVNGAKQEVRRGVVYNASYQSIAYPWGDVPKDRGACTDVVIRALRSAGYDLQELIHRDMRRRFASYPKIYGLRAPDRNIDHRRCANHQVFLRRYGRKLPRTLTGSAASTWQPGDLVYFRLPNGLAHTGVLSNVRNAAGLPLVIHNMSRAAQEDVLGAWEITGHYRFPPEAGRRSESSQE